ncbi:MAG: BamA/TamA family outer membrane protein [Mariniphaga sp.]
MNQIRLFFVCFVFLVNSYHSRAQKDSTKSEVPKIKTGWNFGAIPATTFDTDQGFQYGAAVNFYNYGDGSTFPKYKHSLYLEISHFTKGSGIYRFYYDSESLIPGIQITSDLSYLPDQAYDFYGYNGYESVLNKNWEDQNSSEYKTRMFYKYQQKLFRFKTDFQGKFKGSKFGWVAGFNLLNYSSASVDVDKLNKGKNDADKLPAVASQPGLYEKYIQWGLISQQEANGGFVPELKAGIVYDTRDFKANPMKGVWTEAVISAVPKFLGAESGFSKFSFTHRQYFTLIKDDLSFAYRIGWQQTMGGHVPYYYEPQIISTVLTGSSTTGLGGAKNLRGVRRNRIVGDGFVLGNVELRWKFYYLKLFNQNFYCGLNTFVDFGQVTKKIDFVTPNLSTSDITSNYFNNGAEKMHTSYGAGLRLAMNYNFVVALDYGIATNAQDGDSGIYIGLNYLF